MKVAYQLGSEVLEPYAHEYSPRRYTQSQIFACLVLKMFFKTDYRGLEAILRDSPQFCAAISMKQVPHFTTFQKAERRLLKSKTVQKLLEESLFFDGQE